MNTILENKKMSTLQYVIMVLCFMANMCDGMDVMIVSYAAKAISADWNVPPKEFGIVFSAGLVSMAIGAIFLAPLADKIGRKKTVIISLITMGISSIATGFAPSLPFLVVARLVTGLGVGCLLACISALASEYSSKKMKTFWVSFVMAGYPAGAILSGFVANHLISTYGWHSLFIFAGVVTLLMIPLIVLFLRESLDFLVKKQPEFALNKINKILTAIDAEPISVLPPKAIPSTKSSVSGLFSKELKTSTLTLWFAFFLSFGSFYFLTSWIPKLASDFGMSDSLAIYAGLIFNVGSLMGIVFQGYLSTRFDIRKVIAVFLVMTFLLMITFNYVHGSMAMLILFGCIGFTIQGGFIGFYAVGASLYDTVIRSTGIGWAIGMGRFGAILGPLLGGFLISNHIPTHINFIIFAIPCLIAGIITLFIRLKK
ncbi:benzoate transport [Chryseobacterium rhizosphaerae]|uniref:MFS transporter n=1 Tax=Chryseobacterium rhizosphaerae TaxID=395937 RepID=UPI002861FBE3|nr:MFS transporter [Chryseobacterium rhizosphaerae]MDR6548154.1 benzoate transport [Chryseobacterium rhizosphaerae]